MKVGENDTETETATDVDVIVPALSAETFTLPVPPAPTVGTAALPVAVPIRALTVFSVVVAARMTPAASPAAAPEP